MVTNRKMWECEGSCHCTNIPLHNLAFALQCEKTAAAMQEESNRHHYHGGSV